VNEITNYFTELNNELKTATLLLSCRELRDQQRDLRESLGCRPSLRVLLHTKVGAEKTLEFLKRTKVATRKRLLERQEREQREREEEGGREENEDE
jgi:hypothetical protein